MQSLKGKTTLLRYRHRVSNQTHPPLLLLLHGVGSNEQGLLGLFSDVDPRFFVVSAQAPFPMGPEQYGWYAVDFSTGTPVINAEQADKSRLILVQFINQLAERHGINRQRVYLLGFSQRYRSGTTGPTQSFFKRGLQALNTRLLNFGQFLKQVNTWFKARPRVKWRFVQ